MPESSSTKHGDVNVNAGLDAGPVPLGAVAVAVAVPVTEFLPPPLPTPPPPSETFDTVPHGTAFPGRSLPSPPGADPEGAAGGAPPSPGQVLPRRGRC